MTKKVLITHGLSKHYLYGVWLDMKLRCEDPNHSSYDLYSAKNRKVCKEWKHDVVRFIQWGLENGGKKGLDLDREDNSLGYSPENCRFVPRLVNRHNADMQRRNKTGYEGVWYDKSRGRYVSSIKGRDVLPSNKTKHLGRFFTAEQAVEARNNFIRDNKLPHHRIQEIK